MQITVLGGGNGAYAAAADLSERGHSVHLWRRDARAARALAKRGTLTLLDADGERDIPLAGVHTRIGDAIKDSELIVFPGPAHAQPDVAKALAPHLRDGQSLFLPPGTFGAYLMPKMVRDAGNKADIRAAETGTLPYLTRKHGPSKIAITRRATRLPTGVFPAKHSAEVRAIIAEAYPSVEPCEDALSGALMNAGPIIHPPLILMNAGPIEHVDDWDIHNEGTQPAIRRVTTALDAERIAVRESLGYRPPHFPLADHYSPDGDEWMYGRGSHEQLVDSGDWREPLELLTHRYMREDVALGLAFLVSCARWRGVPAPVATALLTLGETVCGETFSAGPRTIPALGLAALERPDLETLLFEGF